MFFDSKKLSMAFFVPGHNNDPIAHTLIPLFNLSQKKFKESRVIIINLHQYGLSKTFI